jgi:hypothetical protein
MDTQNRELWDRLENEPDKAYRAFECFLSLPSGERTLLEAYRRHVSNPDAAKPSDTWSGWSNTFAWRERVAAYDDHLAIVRREAYERAVEEEVTRQAREVEKARYRSNELMTLGYEEAMHWFEEVGASGMRASDVIQIMRLHLDYLKVFGMEQGSRNEDDWTEEDDEFVETILKEMEAETAADELDEGEDGSESVDDDAG